MRFDFILNSLKGDYSLSSKICDDIPKMRNKDLREIFCSDKTKYKLEKIRTIEGVTYINDSNSTNANSLWYALNEMPNHGKNIILIAGGITDNLDYSFIKEEDTKNIKAFISFGTNNQKLEERIETLDIPIYKSDNLKKIIEFTRDFAKKGDIVLFSPGAASFNMFDNFEERGKQFERIVKSL